MMKRIIKLVFTFYVLLSFSTSCNEQSHDNLTDNPTTSEQPKMSIFSVREIIEGTYIPNIDFKDQSTIEVLSYVENKCNEHSAMMSEPPIKIYFEKSKDLNINLKAPVMTASLILDVVSMHSNIKYEIDEKQRMVAFVIKE